MKNRLTRLIDVKSIVTILTTVVFCVITLMGRVSSEQFLTVFTVVISFYFGTQSVKNKRSEETDNGDQGN